MQIIMELLLIKKKDIVETVADSYAMLFLAAAISLTILNFANYAGIKWLTILAIIDLTYFGIKMLIAGYACVVLIVSGYASYLKKCFNSSWSIAVDGMLNTFKKYLSK